MYPHRRLVMDVVGIYLMHDGFMQLIDTYTHVVKNIIHDGGCRMSYQNEEYENGVYLFYL